MISVNPSANISKCPLKPQHACHHALAVLHSIYGKRNSKTSLKLKVLSELSIIRINVCLAIGDVRYAPCPFHFSLEVPIRLHRFIFDFYNKCSMSCSESFRWRIISTDLTCVICKLHYTFHELYCIIFVRFNFQLLFIHYAMLSCLF